MELSGGSPCKETLYDSRFPMYEFPLTVSVNSYLPTLTGDISISFHAVVLRRTSESSNRKCSLPLASHNFGVVTRASKISPQKCGLLFLEIASCASRCSLRQASKNEI